jgi:hypothetical protein
LRLLEFLDDELRAEFGTAGDGDEEAETELLTL